MGATRVVVAAADARPLLCRRSPNAIELYWQRQTAAVSPHIRSGDAVVVDDWSRRVVGRSMATHLRTELVLEALNHGPRRPGRGKPAQVAMYFDIRHPESLRSRGDKVPLH